MDPLPIASVLTVLTAVVVVLTRVRLGSDRAAGRLSIPPSVLVVHTVAGGLGVLAWAVFLVVGDDRLAYAALPLLWVTAVAGLLVLTRWIPAHGRHSSEPVVDSWGDGPGLSILAHVGMVVGCGVLTAFFLRGVLP